MSKKGGGGVFKRLASFMPGGGSTKNATKGAAKGEREPPPGPTSGDLDEIALHDAFNKFDKNGDGVIDKQELSDLLVEFLRLPKPPTEVQLGRIMRKVDLNNDGTIQFNEFKVMMTERSNTKNQYLEIFQNFDIDKDGYITKDELGQTMRQVHPDTTDEEIDSIMASLDINNDGKISFQEFLNYFVS